MELYPKIVIVQTQGEDGVHEYRHLIGKGYKSLGLPYEMHNIIIKIK